MSDGKVTYEVRADDSKLSSDLNTANDKVKASGSKFSASSKALALGIGAALATAGVAAIKFGAEFEQSIAKASTLFGDVDVDLENLNARILELSDASGIAASELGDTLYNALSAGVPITEDASEAIEFLEKSTRLAKAGFTDVDTAVIATTKTLNAYGLELEEADRIQRILIQTQNNGITTVEELGNVLSGVTPIAAALNVDFENVGAALATLTANGVPTAQAVTQLSALLSELGKEGTGASKALAFATANTELAGMSFSQMIESGQSVGDILNLMRRRADVTGQSMLDVFSSVEAGRAALSLTGDNAETFANNLEAMGTNADVVGEAFDKVSGTTSEKFNKALNQLKNVGIELFVSLAPLLEELLPLLTILVDLISPLVEVFALLLEPIISLVTGALKPLIEAITELVTAAIKPLIEIMTPFASIFGGVIQAIAEAVGDQISNIIRIFTGLIEFITGVFTGNWKRAWEGVKNIFGGIVDGLGTLIKAPINFIIGGINGFIKGLNKIKIPDWVPGIGGRGIDIDLIPKLQSGGMAFGETLAVVGDNPNALANPEVIAPLDQLQDIMFRGMPNMQGMNNMEQPEMRIQLTGSVNVDGVGLGEIVLKNVDEARNFI